MITVFDRSAEAMVSYQKDMLNSQLNYAKSRSRFYGERLLGIETPIVAPDDWRRIPFTTAEDIKNHCTDMVCVGADEVKRIVTLTSTGSDDVPKRLFFSEADLERTVDFFATGMKYMCGSEDDVLICMPSVSENGIGQLLSKGLRMLGASPHGFGIICNYHEAIETASRIKPHTIIGMPSQIRKLALLAPEISPANVLLSADYVSNAATETITRIWDCEVFTHYGLTESGYGCAVDCGFHMGQHIRHDELLLEIIGPDGEILPNGEWGEIVITTLRREAMPLIRYRTGDIGRLMTGACCCGSVLPRLDRVRGRISELRNEINIYTLDELLLTFDDVLDYSASLQNSILTVEIDAAENHAVRACTEALKRKYPGLHVSAAPAEKLSAAWISKRSILRCQPPKGF